MSEAAVIERDLTITVQINFEFAATPDVMKLINELSMRMLDQEFGEKGHMRLAVALRCEVDLLKRIDLLRARGSAMELDTD